MKLRCKNQSCNKLLAIGYGNVQIKCPRCKQISQFQTRR
ncbi:Mu-like prophage protein Com [Kingella negevensis]|uniref:Mu-like prophage protein Com n=2 Tax=Kingella TaxID=32257 RepID=A0A238TCJ6_9NEIS|nr:Mu-like prophage protein Com [Kingella negevensis]SQH25187.1 Mu-like prophage protein Com [Kingella kingae]